MTLTTFEIEQARSVPIHRLVGNPHINRKVKILCPFHKEDTPSCLLFPTGGFKCFGCGAQGDSISFVMKIGGTFVEAVNELNKNK